MHDVRGRAFTFVDPPRRVVSLVPSLTETLFDLGAGPSIVAITDFCIFPPGLALPRIGGTKNPRVEEIRALAPDLVHMNLEENLRRHAEAIESFAPVYVSEPKTVDDVVRLIRDIGELHAAQQAARNWIDRLRRAHETAPRQTFTFACPIWKNPWMWCGGDTYVSSLVESAGGLNVLAGESRYPHASVEAVLDRRPDVVFLPDEPFAFTAQDAAAIRGPRVIGPFPGHLFTWHGTRTVAGLEFLRQALG